MNELHPMAHVLAIAPEAIQRYIARAMRTDPPKEHAAAPTTKMVGRVAVVPVYGVMDTADDPWGDGVNTMRLQSTLANLGNDKAVRAIVLDIDSPGGSVYGIPELGATLREVSAKKRTIAVANPMIASAAYWLASQAREIVVTPSGDVGSIGAIWIHADWSAALEKAGIKPTIVTSSEHKGEMSPYAPLSDAAKEEMQRRVNYFDGMFTVAVAQGRGVTANKVRSDFGRGRMVEAKEAVSRGMADRVGTLDQVLSRLMVDQSDSDRARATVALLELEAIAASVRRW